MPVSPLICIYVWALSVVVVLLNDIHRVWDAHYMLFEYMGFDILNTCLICDMSSSSQDDIGKSMALPSLSPSPSPSPFTKLDQDDIDTGTDTEENTHSDEM